MQASASGIIPVQGKLSFHRAEAIRNADPTKEGATHEPGSGTPCKMGQTPSPACCRAGAEPCQQGSSQPHGSQPHGSQPSPSQCPTHCSQRFPAGRNSVTASRFGCWLRSWIFHLPKSKKSFELNIYFFFKKKKETRFDYFHPPALPRWLRAALVAQSSFCSGCGAVRRCRGLQERTLPCFQQQQPELSTAVGPACSRALPRAPALGVGRLFSLHPGSAPCHPHLSPALSFPSSSRAIPQTSFS